MRPDAVEHDRLCELLADQALDGLSPDQELELEALIAAGHVDDDFSLHMTAAVLELALQRPRDVQPMPFPVRVRLEAAGAAWAATTAQIVRPASSARRVLYTARRLSPWLAAAACLGLAVFARLSSRQPDPVALAENDPNKLVVQLAGWGDPGQPAPATPEPKAVQGHICWSEQRQCGYLKLVGLPRNDCEHQYQVWIIDERGMDQRISGGIFDCQTDECVIPIRPAIPVHDAKAFAITMEKPGGTAVSDMTHKVAIGRCQKH